jgi:alkylhydroperoxidase family enzyme
MLDFAVKLTRTPYKHTRADVEALRAAGFDDTGILQVTLIAAYFNYINRVADALGVGKPTD